MATTTAPLELRRGLDQLASLPPEERKAQIEALSKLFPEERREEIWEALLDSVEPGEAREPADEEKMTAVMGMTATALGLTWKKKSPTDHPYGAQLDGALFSGSKRLCVVEFTAESQKQIRGAVLDLIAHPEKKKVLLVGAHANCPYPRKMKHHIKRVLRVLRSKGIFTGDLGVFTEVELIENPGALARYLEIPERQ